MAQKIPTFENPLLVIETEKIVPGKVTWRSPSNIALIKYWGKHGVQLPRNPSISFTLDQAYSETTMAYAPKKGADKGVALSFFFHDEPNEAFRVKIVKFLEQMVPYFPFIRQLEFTIHSTNSFPHSAGIASSASAMSALALCLCSLEDRFFKTLAEEQEFRQKASFIARLGSGSASRSIYEGAAIWGAHGEVEGSSDLYAIGYTEKIHSVFHSFHDDILIISGEEKSVSSRAGHQLMVDNIYAENRYAQARKRFLQLLAAMEMGDLERFGQIVENEALTLHALMMTSNPSYVLMKPNTLEAIERIRAFRRSSKIPVYFTLDAGPNIHLLYPDANVVAVKTFVKEQLVPLCEGGLVIEDWVGKGPLEGE